MATLQERLDAYKKASGKSGDTRSLAERVQSYKTAGRDNIVSRLNKWFTNNDIFVSNYQKRTAGTTGSYDDKFDSGASSWLETVTNQKNNFDIEARAIKSYLETNRDEFDSEWLDNALKSLSAAQKSQESILAGTKSFNDYWSQWDTEESYNRWAAGMKDREAKLNYDLRAGKAEISRLETISSNASALSKRITELENTLEARRKYAMRMGTTTLIDSSKEEAELSALKAEYDSKYKNFNLDELAAEINDKKSYYTLAERMQSAEALKNDAMSASDFETYAAKGAAIKNPTSKEAEDGVYIFGNRLGGDVEVGNVVTYSRDNYEKIALGEMNGGGSQYGKSIYHFMTDDEVKIYNYYIGKGDKTNAQKYLESLTDTLNQRKAGEMYKGIEGNTALEMVFGVAAGLDQFTQGVANLFNGDDYIPTSSNQYLSGMIREDLADNGPNVLGSSLGQIGYDLITTGSNMLPSILIGGGFGAALLGASAGGNAKAEMLRMGYSKDQATAYGVLVGASESLLEYAFSGISSIGGKAWQTLGKSGIASKVDNILGNISVKAPGIVIALGKTLGGAAGEAFEEGLQSILEPWFKSFVVGGDIEAPDWEEVAYSSLLGALSGGVFEGIGSAATVSSVSGVGRNIKKTQDVSKLLELGQTYSADSVAYKLAGKINDVIKSGGKVNAYSIGQLYMEEGAMLTEQNVSDLTRGLEELGWDSKSASVTAKAYAQFLEGTIEETEEVKMLLSENQPLTQALIKKLIGENTTAYQRTKGYVDLGRMSSKSESDQAVVKPKLSEEERAAYEAADKMIRVDQKKLGFEASRDIARDMVANTEAAPQRDAVDRVYKALNVKGEYGYSEGDGVKLKSSGEAAEVVDVVSTKDGEMKVKLSDGKTVDAKELDFRSEGEALVYETVANLGVDPASAWSIIKNYDPNGEQRGDEYALGAVEAFKYGKIGEKNISSSGFAAKLTESQRKLAYDLGRFNAKNESEARQKQISEIISKIANKKKASGSLTYDKSVDVSSLREDQKVQISVLGKVAEGLGVKVRLFESGVDENGKSKFTLEDGTVISDNGWYDPDTGEIWVDVNAGDSRNGLILITSAHELTHFIKDWSPAKYKVFADFLVNTYGESGKSVDEIVRAHMEKSRHDLTYDEAFDEIVARSCESFLMDRDVDMRIVELTQRDKTLAQKIKTFIGQLLAKLKKIAEDLGLKPDSEKGRLVSGMTDSLSQLHDLWVDALADAGKSYRAAEVSGEKGKVQFAERNFSEKFTTDTLNSFNISKPGDYIHVQRQVFNTLLKEGFFTDVEKRSRTDVNEESGMIIETNKSGIDETFSLNNYVRLGKFKKIAKLSTIRSLPDAIKYGHVLADDVDNIHNDGDNKKFAYLEYPTVVDGKDITLKLAIKKSPQKNKFWVHSIYTIENVSDSPASTNNSTEAGHITADNGGIIPQPDEKVNSKSKKMSERNLDAVTNREVLATALESAAQNDIERERLAEYKAEIAKYDALGEELRQVRAEIKEISFSKGKRDTERLRGLKDRATELANNINTYDKRLLRLEAAAPLRNVLKREVDSARYTEMVKSREQIKAIREQRDRKLEEQKIKSRARVEDMRASGIRAKIKKIRADIESTLLHPTDGKYIPVPLGRAMIEVCDLIDIDTPLVKKDGTPNAAQEKRERTKARLSELAAEYENLKHNEDQMLVSEHDEQIDAYLKDLRNRYDDVSLNEMSYEELKYFHDVLKSIMGTLRDARKVIGKNDARTLYEYGDAIIEEQKNIKETRGERGKFQKQNDKFVNLSLSPLRNVERMSGYNDKSALVEITRDFEEGVRRKNLFEMRAKKTFEALTAGNNEKAYHDAIYRDFGGKKYVDSKGKKFGISKMQMMQAILSYEREQANPNHRHISNGGFTFADLDLLNKGEIGEAISAENSHSIFGGYALVTEFIEKLAGDKWAQDYMQASREFFNGMAKDAINDTYLLLKHRILARDKNYIPYEVDKSYVVREITGMDALQQTINSYGMLQETVKNASQPLIITGLNNMLDRHIDQVGSVYGLAIPIRNFNKIWNISEKGTEGDATPKQLVKGAIEENWGADGQKSIEQMVIDLQSNRQHERSKIERAIESGYIGATFALNLSVVTKQIGSLYTANSMLDKSHSSIAMLTNLANTMIHFKKLSAEVDKYTAAIYNRREGLSNQEIYTLATQAKRSRIARALNRLPALINPSKWITFMDASVALSLWKYVKADVKKSTNLEGEALLEATAKKFNDVIENTQSMNDVLHRPEIQKRGDLLSRGFSVFKTDLYQSAGLLRVAIGRYSANGSKENAKALRRTVASIAKSALWGSLVTTFFALIRYKVNPYRDDEEELTAESWLKRQGIQLMGDLVGYLMPIAGGEIVGFAENVLFGETDELIDNIAISAANDVYDAILTVADAVREGEMPDAKEWDNLFVKAATAFGVPASNIKRTVTAIKLHAEDIANGEFFSFEAGRKKSNTQKLYDAVMRNDAEDIEDARSLFKTESAINSALKKGLRDNDARIKSAALVLRKNDIRSFAGYVKEITSEGKFDSETVEGAIRAEADYLDNKLRAGAEALRDGASEDYRDIVRALRDEYREVLTQDEIVNAILSYKIAPEEEVTEKAESIYKSGDINAALAAGDTDTALSVTKELLSVKYENELAEAKRKAEESGERFIEWRARKDAERAANTAVRKTVTEYWKPLYLEAFKKRDVSEMNRIRKLLYGIGIYGNLSELDKTLAAWKKS